MLVFHEGLPGSGKSYEAVVYRILPALKDDRKVFAYIEGLNHEKIAEVTGLPLSYVRSNLIQIDRDDVPRIPDIVDDNSLVVIDELQNFWPASRQKCDDYITQFVAEHRHRGIDIVALGQDLRDCHALWKRRVSEKVVFTKLDYFGFGNRYAWVLYKAIAGEKFKMVTRGVRKYESQYFGTYQSHVSDDVRTDEYTDDRAIVWKKPSVLMGLIGLFLVFLLFGYIKNQFFPVSEEVEITHTETPIEKKKPVDNTQSQTEKKQSYSMPVYNDIKLFDKPDQTSGYLSQMQSVGSLRLSGLIIYSGTLFGEIEVLDKEYRVLDRISLTELADLGYQYRILGRGIEVYNSNERYVIRPWPLDDRYGQANYDPEKKALDHELAAYRIRQQMQRVF
jgi:zona occludens toxin